jgi:peptidyl-prolyl cis-trans isomerase D
MLQGLRSASNTVAGRILLSVVMGFIIISFAIWGIGNIFQGFGRDHLAYVGWNEITISAYRNAFQTYLQRLQSQYHRAITNDEARQAGLDRQVLQGMISDTALDQEARNLGLAISDKQIAASILEDSTFKGPTGQFDRERFLELLRENGFSEQSFVAQQRTVYLRREIQEAIAGALTAPRSALEVFNRYSAETRAVDYIVLPAKAAGTIAAPTEAVLKSYYEDRKESYRAPEFRSLVLLSVTPASLAKPDLVSDADAKQLYESVKAQRFATPEKRDVQQIIFPTEAEAQTAEARIKGGTDFADIAAERHLAAGDFNLGTKAKTDILDKALADAAFALPLDGVSEPVKSAFGYALLRITKISPASTTPYDAVAKDLKMEIAVQRAEGDATKLRDKIEDLRSQGKSLTEVAKALGLRTRNVDAVDDTGHDKAGAVVPDLHDSNALLKAAYAADIGSDNEFIETKDHGFVWYEVAKIEPARVRDFGEVKSDVEKAWRDDETAKRLAAKTTDLAKKIDGGATLQSIATAEGVDVKTLPSVPRAGSPDLPAGAVAQIFNVAVGAAGSAAGTGDSRILFKVTGSKVAPLDMTGARAKALSDRYAADVANDIFGQYTAKVEKDIGFSVNPDALRIALGSSETN